MNKKKIIIPLVILCLILGVVTGVYFYNQGDHEGPAVTTAIGYEAGYGEKIGLFDLVTAISDDNAYTVRITKGGEVAKDGRSTVFAKAGTEEVEITAVDELGQSTVKNVKVKIVDNKPPMLSAEDITISLGDAVDYKSGVTATDEMDGNLTGSILVDTSKVNEAKAGVYTVVYSVSDRSGNESVLQTALTILSPEARLVNLSQQNVNIEGNGHYQLSATVEPSSWGGQIKWASSDESVAVVHDGLISWVGTGNCTITCTAGEASSSCQVTCGYVTVSTITVNLASVTLDYKQSETLSTYIVPSNWNGTIDWTSSDTTVATVEKGTITWAGQGQCVVTASAEGVLSSCTVTCNEPQLESLDIPEDTINLEPDATYAIFPVIVPDIWPGEIVWGTSDPSVAIVSDGVVTWVGPGTCTITAAGGDIIDSVIVNCKERKPLENLLDDLFGGGDDEDGGGTVGEENSTHNDFFDDLYRFFRFD